MNPTRALRRVADRLDAGMRERLVALPADAGEGTGFARLAAGPGRVGLESLLAEIAKLELLRGLALPPDLPRGAHPGQIKRFRPCAAAGAKTRIGNHSCRATGITAYLKNGGTLIGQANSTFASR